LTNEVLIQRFITSSIGKNIIKNSNFEYFDEFVRNYLKNFDFIYVTKTIDDYEIDKIISKKSMIHLQKFFNKNNFQYNTKSNKEKKSNKRKTSKLGFYRIRK
jgi:superfamily II DNA helicase RecQ